MLVLSRKVGQKIVVSDNITIVVLRVAGNRISLGIEAPADVRIVRGELAEAVTSFDEDATAGPALQVPSLQFAAAPVAHRAR